MSHPLALVVLHSPSPPCQTPRKGEQESCGHKFSSRSSSSPCHAVEKFQQCEDPAIRTVHSSSLILRGREHATHVISRAPAP
eukprot:345455-Amphidinium_carterae.1